GVDVDWSAAFVGAGASRVDLPTYAFQRQRYWLETGSGASGAVAGLGLEPAEHPLLGVAVELPESGAVVFAGRLSLRTHPWLADHAVAGTVLFPGTGFVELVTAAGDQVGCGTVEELTLQTPLVLPEAGGIRLRVTVGAPDESGRRDVSIHSRPDGSEHGDEWTRHAAGVMAVAETQALAPARDLTVWPPEGAVAVATDDLYEDFADTGYDYGRAFQGVQAAWRRGDEVFVEAALLEEQQAEASRTALHPALLDAALHGLRLGDFYADRTTVRLPFAWRGVSVSAVGATRVRVVLAPAGGDAVSVTVADHEGQPVAEIESLVLRTVEPGGFEAGRRGDELFRVEWQPSRQALPTVLGAGGHGAVALVGPDEFKLRVELTEAGGPYTGLEAYPDLASLAGAIEAGGAAVPDVVLVACVSGHGTDRDIDGAAAGVRTALADALTTMRALLAEDRFAATRLVFLTRGAVVVSSGEHPDLLNAPLWGLIRSAQAENPGRFVLVDLDGAEASRLALPGALATDEPQLAVRDGEILLPRVARVAPALSEKSPTPPAQDDGDDGLAFDPLGTVLITGATGALGAMIARHLVSEHGVRRLLLLSRRGLAADGAAELCTDLTAQGAEVTLAPCDAADREALADVLAGIPAAHPLTAVVHAAGVLDDGVMTTITQAQIERVLRPKVDAALHLHELTEGLDLSAFILFSGAAGTLGTAGQGVYAAANVFLDALAHHRHTRNLPAQALAWGLWAERSGMTERLGEGAVQRLSRMGIAALESARGLALFDAARTVSDAVVLPMRLDTAALRAGAQGQTIPAVLRGLVRRPAAARSTAGADGRAEPGSVTGAGAAAGGAEGLRQRLAELGEDERRRALLDLVRTHAATALGYATPAGVEAGRHFKDLGFDSLTAVELRNLLNGATGLRLPATLIFDYPTPGALAAHLTAELSPPDAMSPIDQGLRELDALESVLTSLTGDDPFRGRIQSRLLELLARCDAGAPGGGSHGTSGAPASSAAAVSVTDQLESASDDDLFSFIDEQM
ncbi:SDR family NAD(P)-dependent oxidoreductase, partial [Streptomyces sp. NPDC002125]